MIQKDDHYATHAAAKENGGELYAACIRAMMVFQPTERTPNRVDLAGFHLRTEDSGDVWIVGDRDAADGNPLFLLNPDKFATSRQLHVYLASVQSVRQNAEEPDNDPEPPNPESWRPGVI